ncbi:hypothetical protein ACQ4PT_062309 [Festuca glaucescens]
MSSSSSSSSDGMEGDMIGAFQAEYEEAMLNEEAEPRRPRRRREFIRRDRLGAHDRLFEDYFADDCNYPPSFFRRSFISGCPVLECLLIYDSFGFRSLKINSSTLRSISIKAGNRFGSGDIEIKELVIENAPCLQRLFGLHFGYGLHVSVLSAPKLEAFGCFFTWAFSSTKLVLGSSVMQEPHVNRLSMARCKIKILAVHLYDLSLDTIIQLLAYFPCLEKLYVASNYLRQSNFWRTKHQNLITSLDIRLKTIVLDSYRGQKSEVNFATFFVLNAKVLELMTLVVPDKRYNEKFLELQRRKLQLENKASRGAQFHFTPKSNSRLDNVMNMKDAHDLDSWDPFIC